MGFEASLSSDRAIVDKEIAAFFDHMCEGQNNQFLKYNYETLEQFVLRQGKRLRPITTIKSYAAFSGNEKKIYPLSIVSELFHTSSLIHDDIMDEDSIRRGSKTMHVLYEDYFRRHFNDESYHGSIFSAHAKRFGSSIAIMQGNLLYSLAYRLLLTSDLEFGKKQEALALFNHAYARTNEGQMLDVLFSSKNKISVAEYEAMVEGKTACPLGAAIGFGAMLAGADKSQRTALQQYSYHAGIAFQIMDDIMDLSSGRKKRLAGSDVRKGSKTLVIVHALQHAASKDKKIMMKIVGNHTASSEDIQTVMRILEKTESVSYAQMRAERHVMQAKHSLLRLKANKERKEFFLQLADYILARSA